MAAVAYSRLEREMLALYAPPFRRKSTYCKIRTVLREFAELPIVHKVTDLTPIAIAEWIKTHGDRKQITNQSYLKAFRPAVNYALAMGWLKIDPWSIRSDWFGQLDEDLPDDEASDDEDEDYGRRHHSIEQIVAVLDQADAESLAGTWESARDQCLVYTLAYTGLRAKEALGLKVDDLRLEKRIIAIRRRRRRKLKTKHSSAVLGIADDLAVVLQRWLPRAGSAWLLPNVRKRSTPWMHGGAGRKPVHRVRALGERAGVEGLTLLSFRHSLATHSGRFGFSEQELKTVLRHTSLRTQEHYKEIDLDNARELASRISYRQHSRSNCQGRPISSPL